MPWQHGQTKNKAVFEQLYNHDILLIPSVQATDGDREGIPQTAAEGMATGIPVITSTHAGLPELIVHEQTGLQVPERDAEAIARSIQFYFENPALVKK